MVYFLKIDKIIIKKLPSYERSSFLSLIKSKIPRKSNLLSYKSELQYRKSNLQPYKSNLLSYKSELLSRKKELRPHKIELLSHKIELLSCKSKLRPCKSKLLSHKLILKADFKTKQHQLF